MSLNVSLTPHLEAFVHETVTAGRYQSASEVVRTALRLLEAQKGLDSGPAAPVTPAFWQGLRTKLQQSAADNA
jgi:antitoxin ParD1/3/4